MALFIYGISVYLYKFFNRVKFYYIEWYIAHIYVRYRPKLLFN